MNPQSVCLNTTEFLPFNQFSENQNQITNQTKDLGNDETNCNACICVNGQPKCSNIWCGLPNCLKSQVGIVPTQCELHEVSLFIRIMRKKDFGKL